MADAESKLKIFSLQTKNNFAFINNKNLLKKYKRKKYLGKLNFVDSQNYKRIKSRIKNNYLNFQANKENIRFIFALSKVLRISEKSFVRSLKSFKGLPHRYEIFLKKNNKVFINDSKATNVNATWYALESMTKPVIWIVGGVDKGYN